MQRYELNRHYKTVQLLSKFHFILAVTMLYVTLFVCVMLIWLVLRIRILSSTTHSVNIKTDDTDLFDSGNKLKNRTINRPCYKYFKKINSIFHSHTVYDEVIIWYISNHTSNIYKRL